MKARPIVKATEPALRQWQLLRRQGLCTGSMVKKAGGLIPKPGADPKRVRVKVGKDGGAIYDPNGRWVASFAKDVTDDGRRVWRIESVEALR